MQLLQSRRLPTRRRTGANGGFPEPPAGEPVRIVRRSHPECGAETRIRVPRALPEGTVHRVLCDGCRERFEADARKATEVQETPDRGSALTDRASRLGAVLLATAAALGARLGKVAGAVRGTIGERAAALPRPPLPDIPRARLWAWASVPLAAVGVIAGLLLIQGADPAPAPAGSSQSAAATEAEFVEEPGYTLALPEGWKRTNPPDGAAFAAASSDGLADATLWIERAPNLSLGQFERRSLQQLAELGGEARVVDRVEGPTVESSIVELRTDAPIGGGVTAPYRVTLRAAGPFRHYFVTVTQPGADPDLLADAELMHGSLRPEVELADGGGPGA